MKGRLTRERYWCDDVWRAAALLFFCFFFQAEDGIRGSSQSRGLGDVYERQGLDSSEIDNPPSKFKKLFKKASENNFITVAHAGEEGPPEYIWEALKLLNVKRIDHGVQCFKDKNLVQELSKSQIPLTVCPLSNVKLKVFKTLKEHNLKKMLNKNLMVMINSDDPAYFGGYLNQNLIETQAALNLSKDEIKTLLVNSFRSSFLSEERKKEWINKI